MGKISLGDESQRAVEGWANFRFFALAGLLSGLVTAGLEYPAGRFGWILGGPFGAIMGFALAACGVLRGYWKAILLPVATTAVFFLSFLTTGYIEINFPRQLWATERSMSPGPVSLLAGGFVGGFLILVVVLILVNAKAGILTLAVKTIAGSLIGGILGVIGPALGPYLGMTIWFGLHVLRLTAPGESYQNALGGRSDGYSLYVVWQTGMAVVLAVVLWTLKAKSRNGSSKAVGANQER